MPLLLDPDPDFQYISGSRTAKSMRIHEKRIHNTAEWLLQIIKNQMCDFSKTKFGFVAHL
jgi:hypothetical protein